MTNSPNKKPTKTHKYKPWEMCIRCNKHRQRVKKLCFACYDIITGKRGKKRDKTEGKKNT